MTTFTPSLPATASPTPAATPTARTATTATPVETASPTPGAGPEGGATAAEEAATSEPPDRDLSDLALRLRPAANEPAQTDATEEASGYQVGHSDAFFVTDLADGSVRTIQATLQVVSEHAYWYADDELDLSADGLEKTALAFEGNIYPAATKLFAGLLSPGSGDGQRLAILHTRLGGASGYYGAQDAYPRQVHPYSNERQMIYVDGVRLTPGTSVHLGVLAHELQHALHWSVDEGEDAWVNEGMSELLKDLAGYGATFVEAFLRAPDTQLNYWPSELGRSTPHYGAATLFMRFLALHHGGYDGLRLLVEEPSDGMRGVESFLSRHGKTFLDVFKDWVVANYVGAAEGRYSYGEAAVRVQDVETMTTYGQKTEALPQFSSRYIDLRLEGGNALVRFEGDSLATQVPTRCLSGRRCWWGNRGDSIDSTLTRAFDLSAVQDATLEFWTWFNLEEGWDYAYVEVSDDEGVTWEILEGRSTTAENPAGNSYGPGFTGQSEGWAREEIDLSAYAGRRVLLRFEYVTDDSVYLDGFVFDDLSIPQIDFFDGAETDAGWQARGFERIENELAQRFLVQIIEHRADASEVVREMTLEEDNKGETVVKGFGAGLESAVIVVSPVTPGTHQPASYTLTVSPGGNGD